MASIEVLLQKCNSLTHFKQLQAHLIITDLFRFYTYRSKFLNTCATSAAGSLHYAVVIFRTLPSPTTNDWNAIIRGFAYSDKPTNAISLYLDMSRNCVPKKPDALSCSFALKACARSLARVEASQIHSYLLRLGFEVDFFLQTTLLDVYAKTGDLDCARKVFDEMPVNDIVSWNALISGFAQGNRPNEALDLFKRMGLMKLKANDATVLGALSACSQLGAAKEGEKIYDYIKKQKLDKNTHVCNAVIDMFAKCGSIDKAHRVFQDMTCAKCSITWNTMIMAFAMHGDGFRAMELFEQMDRESKRDSISYLAVLCACNHAGLVDHGLKFFHSMKTIGIELNIKHYGCVVDFLGRAGRLTEAFEIVNSMPIPCDVVLYQTILGACKTHANVDLAEEASRKLMEMGSNNCGDFVLLSNLYACKERWIDVKRVRDAMKKGDVRKVPGFSYMEVNGMIHRFINGDRVHREWREIYGKMEEVRNRIREHGYEPETEYVLHDIGYEEKENALCYHSEKLAVVYGLISTKEGSEIQVIKNLRICGDCHVVMKLISKVYQRDIVVRDRARFHRFKAGSCSCKDYW